MKKWFYTAAAAVVTALALLYAFWDVDFAELLDLLAGANYWTLFPLLGFQTLFFLFTATRWRLLLRPLGFFSVAEVLPAMMIGFAANNVLPAHLGEFVRTMAFARKFQKPKSSVLTTQVLERMLDIFAILAIYFVAVFTIREFPASIRTGSYVTALVFLAACLGILLLLAFPARISALAERLTARLPQVVRRRIVGLIHGVSQGLDSFRSFRLMGWMLGHSALKWMSNAGAVWISLWAYGADVPFSASMMVVAVTAFAVTLPAAPGYFGSIQAAFVFTLTPFGIEREIALAASIFLLLATWLPVTLIGGYYFFTLKTDLQNGGGELEAVGPADAEPD